MNIRKYTIAAFLILVGCTNNSKNGNEKNSLINYCSSTKSQYTNICELSENTEYIHHIINDLHKINDTTIIISTPNAIIEYNIQGIQKSIIGRQGRGPQEFLSLTGVDISESKIFAWCGNSQKILSYNIHGEFLEEKRINSMSNKVFCVYNDSLLCQYHTLPVGEDNIAIYNINDGSKIWSTQLVKHEDELLNLAHKSGGMCIKSDSLFWICPSELSVYSIPLTNLNNTSKSSCIFTIHDSDFKIDKIKNARELINSNRISAINYINENSRVVDLFFNKENICIAAEVGEFELKDNNILDASNRKLKVYEIERQSSRINAVELNYDSRKLFYSFNANKFYSVLLEDINDEPQYNLGYLELFN